MLQKNVEQLEDIMTIHPEDAALVEANILERRAQLGLGLTKFMGLGMAVMVVVMAVMWLFARQYIQLLGVSALIAQMMVCSGLYHILYRQRKVAAGQYLFVTSFLILIAVGPLLVPETLAAVSIGYVILITVGILLLGKKTAFG